MTRIDNGSRIFESSSKKNNWRIDQSTRREFGILKTDFNAIPISRYWREENEIRSEIFKEKFYFQVLFKSDELKYAKPWIFNLFTFFTDFYMSSYDIKLLKYFFYENYIKRKLINSSHSAEERNDLIIINQINIKSLRVEYRIKSIF